MIAASGHTNNAVSGAFTGECFMKNGAVALVTDGSVRDGLSLLDQAISHSEGEVTEEMMRDMMGLADHSRIIDIFEAIAGGDIKKVGRTRSATRTAW